MNPRVRLPDGMISDCQWQTKTRRLAIDSLALRSNSTSTRTHLCDTAEYLRDLRPEERTRGCQERHLVHPAPEELEENPDSMTTGQAVMPCTGRSFLSFPVLPPPQMKPSPVFRNRASRFIPGNRFSEAIHHAEQTSLPESFEFILWTPRQKLHCPGPGSRFRRKLSSCRLKKFVSRRIGRQP